MEAARLPPAAPSAAAPSAGAPSEAPASAGAGGEPVTVDWWHITTGEPGKSDFQAAADAYMAENPNVTIKLTVLENEAFKTKLSTTAAADYPDLFQSWGGGIMAAQADAGLLKDITADIADWKDTINPGAMSIYDYNGKQYGVPWDMGMIGFWYNKALFEQAGITAPPATWDEYLAAVEKLRAAGIDPLAIAGKDKWPSMHLWTYLVLRTGGGDALSEMIQSGDWNTEACTKAGEEVLKLNALDPYQAGYKSADYNAEAASVGNGKAAMELMGQWAPSVQADQSADKKGLGEDLGWFAFPTVAGGAGAATDGVGGGNRYCAPTPSARARPERTGWPNSPQRRPRRSFRAAARSPTRTTPTGSKRRATARTDCCAPPAHCTGTRDWPVPTWTARSAAPRPRSPTTRWTRMPAAG